MSTNQWIQLISITQLPLAALSQRLILPNKDKVSYKEDSSGMEAKDLKLTGSYQMKAKKQVANIEIFGLGLHSLAWT